MDTYGLKGKINIVEKQKELDQRNSCRRIDNNAQMMEWAYREGPTWPKPKSARLAWPRLGSSPPNHVKLHDLAEHGPKEKDWIGLEPNQ